MTIDIEENEAPLDAQEDEEDLRYQKSAKRYDAAIAASDWTAETLINQLRKGNIQLDPTFQRRDAWNFVRKSQYIESLIIGVPTPQIILAERREKRGAYIVIDGKQRLLSLRQFAAAPSDAFEGFALTGLKARPDLNGRTYDEITNGLIEIIDGSGSDFENSTIRTVVIKSWETEAFLYEVFLRINSGSVQLSPQELRQALHPGPFADALNKFVIESPAVKRALGLRAPDFRMRDNELVIRYVAYKFFLHEYNGSLKDLLDKTTEYMNQNWKIEQEELKQTFEGFTLVVETTFKIFGKDAFKKWNGQKFESRLNRAVFDSMAMYFSVPEIVDLSLAHAEQIVNEFKRLCEHDSDFWQSVTTTTKSIDAVQMRLEKWAESLSGIIGLQLSVPLVGS